jgi:hypothetical protein
MNAKFQPGRLAATPGALEALARSGQTADFFLDKHLCGDWGCVSAGDRSLNDQAVADGSRILSVYRTLTGVEVWVITEATDDQGQRAATTILLPDEY